MLNFLFVAFGGALGAAGRYAISLIELKHVFPFQTFITNLLGAIAMGFLVGIFSAKKDLSPKLTLFLKVGVCGGFTTFSTFSLETLTLFEEGKFSIGIIYAVLSVCCCVLGVYLGQLAALKTFA